MAGRSAILALLDLMDEAFDGHGADPASESQALLPNLGSVPVEAWTALPAGATRSIADIAIHVGACKIMYDDYAFGSASLRFATPEVEPWTSAAAPPADVVAWLRSAHTTLTGHVRDLVDDAELDRERLTNWGERWATRSIIGAMITHDAYHAGEINHVRSLLSGDDRWRFQQLGFG
jgi:uncharacterized damage-inducible protein DinB